MYLPFAGRHWVPPTVATTPTAEKKNQGPHYPAPESCISIHPSSTSAPDKTDASGALQVDEGQLYCVSVVGAGECALAGPSVRLAWESGRGGDFLFRFLFLLLSLLFSSPGWRQTSRGAMALFSSCYCHPRISNLKVDRITPACHHFPWPAAEQRFMHALRGTNNDFFGKRVAYIGRQFESRWSFIVGSKVFLTSKVERTSYYRKGFTICASWFTGTQIASNAFTLGTAAVLPFYFLMVVAPKSELTKRTMESSIPYVVLGVAYAYLLFLSWTPDTLRMMFASKYLLPELQGIAKMFSSEMTLASAWIHLLAVDLFAARQVFHDGLKNEIETRHSVSLCLLFCPVGILTHVITKVLTKSVGDCE